MKHKRLLYIIGDVHGDFKALNRLIDREMRHYPCLRQMAKDSKMAGEDFQAMIIQCGDLAYYWPGFHNSGRIEASVDFLPEGRVPIFWIGGNYDDWDEFDRLGPGIAEIEEGIFHCAFGTILRFGPGTILLAGGAESPDRRRRIQKMLEGSRKCWWKQEGINGADMARLISVPEADIVISHTFPESFPICEFLDLPRGDSRLSSQRTCWKVY